MERKSRSLDTNLKSVILYRDDVRKIADILSKGKGKVSIENMEYKFSSIDELNDLDEEFITNLELSQSDPYVSVSFRESSIRLYASDDSPSSVGIFEQLRNYISTRRRKLAWLTENSYLAGGALGISWWLMMFGDLTRYKALMALSMLTLGALWTWNCFQWPLKRFSTIHLHIQRKERFGFFFRKKDEIRIAIISAVVGAVIAIVLTKIFS